MDDGTFDTVTRSLGTAASESTSRRGMIRLLGGLALGGPLSLFGMQTVDAKCKKPCGPCKRCKRGKCKPRPAGTACAGGTCQGGKCVPATAPPPVACPVQACAEGCVCNTAVEGDAFCAVDGEALLIPCTDSGDCAPGNRCIPSGAITVCFPECAAV